MSRLLVITHPNLVEGFFLAGVEAFPAEDVETVEALINGFVQKGEAGLVAIDDSFVDKIKPQVMKRLEESKQLFYLAVPGGEPHGPESPHRQRLALQIRRAIGIQITFKGVENQGS